MSEAVKRAFHYNTETGEMEIRIVSGSKEGSLIIKWHHLGAAYCPQLTAFNDVWFALPLVPELIAYLGRMDNVDVSPEELAGELEDMGYKRVFHY